MSEAANVTVRVPQPLMKVTGGQRELEAEGSNVSEVLNWVGERHPEFLPRILAEGGEPREFLNIFVNGTDIRFESGLETPVNAGDEVSIVPSIAGG